MSSRLDILKETLNALKEDLPDIKKEKNKAIFRKTIHHYEELIYKQKEQEGEKEK